MPRLIHISPKAHAAARRASRRWLLAGLAGGAVTATCAHAELFQVLPLIADALATLAAGALTMFILAPHRLMRTFTDDFPAIDELSQRVRALADGDRSQPLTELVMDRDDAIGRLTVAIHDLAAETVTTRSHSRLMHKRMDTEVDRKTRQATAELERQANTDPLTGLGNRREMEKQLDKMLRSRVGSRRQMTIVAIDLDRFKQVNDTLGHEVGDQCLSFLGDLFKSCLRREDCPIRLGGDEFVVILPDQTMEDADAVSRRLKTLYAMMPWPAREPARPTLSIGAATNWITTVDEAVDLLRRADDALYEAKHAGRSTTRRGAA